MHKAWRKSIPAAVSALGLAATSVFADPASMAFHRPAPAVQRTAWGDPDLQGIWDFATITPLERPASLAGKEVLTDQEAADFEKQTLAQRNPDRRDGGAGARRPTARPGSA